MCHTSGKTACTPSAGPCTWNTPVTTVFTTGTGVGRNIKMSNAEIVSTVRQPGFVDFIFAWLSSFLVSFFLFAVFLILYNISNQSKFGLFVPFFVIYGIVLAIYSLLVEAIVLSIFRGRKLDITLFSLSKAASIGFAASAGPWALVLLMPSPETRFQQGNGVLFESGMTTISGLLRVAPEIVLIGVCGSIAALVFCVVIRKRLVKTR